MTKASYRRKYLIEGSLTVSEGSSMNIVVGRKVAGRQDAEAVATSSHLICKLQAETKRGGGVGFRLIWVFEISKPIPRYTPPPTRPHLLIFSNCPHSPSAYGTLTMRNYADCIL